MSKICIFDLKKTCDDCGECMICDLDKSKTCDDCGACLEISVNDMKEVQIDEIVEDDSEILDTEEAKVLSEIEEEEEKDYVLIDDINGLEEMIEELKEGSNTENLGYEEIYPGLIVKKVKKLPIKKYGLN
jgi:DNA-directed RNA polymerase subunit M/transcription elongation factor TFIIS